MRRRLYPIHEFLKQLNRFQVDFRIIQSVAGLVKKHEGIGFVKVFSENWLIKPVGFPEHALEVIAIDRLPEIFFAHRYARQDFFGLAFHRHIHQSQRVF